MAAFAIFGSVSCAAQQPPEAPPPKTASAPVASTPAAPTPAPAAAAMPKAPAPAPATPTPAAKTEPAPKAEAVPFFKEWTMEDLVEDVADLGKGRNYIAGGRAFQQACSVCHAFSNFWQGTGQAPDLTSVGTKFSRESILESIIEPSATINGQYYNTRFKLKNDSVIEGILIDEDETTYRVAPSAAAPQATIPIAIADVVSKEPSTTSPMLTGLINSFTREQVLDLMAFLVSGGNQDAPVYKQ